MRATVRSLEELKRFAWAGADITPPMYKYASKTMDFEPYPSRDRAWSTKYYYWLEEWLILPEDFNIGSELND